MHTNICTSLIFYPPLSHLDLINAHEEKTFDCIICFITLYPVVFSDVILGESHFRH